MRSGHHISQVLLDDIVDEGLRKEATERPTPLAERFEKALSASAEFCVCTCKTL